jgi:hypothetical protein
MYLICVVECQTDIRPVQQKGRKRQPAALEYRPTIQGSAWIREAMFGHGLGTIRSFIEQVGVCPGFGTGNGYGNV